MEAAHIVIRGVFNSRDGEDENQRHDGGEPGQGGHLRDQLQGKEGVARRPRPSPPPTPPPSPWICLQESPRVYLQNEKEQEVGIGNFLELLEEVDRQEGEDIVLGGLDAVTLRQAGRDQHAASTPHPEPGSAAPSSLPPQTSAPKSQQAQAWQGKGSKKGAFWGPPSCSTTG